MERSVRGDADAFFASSPLHLVSLIAVQKRGMPRNKPFFAANDVCLG